MNGRGAVRNHTEDSGRGVSARPDVTPVMAVGDREIWKNVKSAWDSAKIRSRELDATA